MRPNLTTSLCTQCGLCCDGSLFADVELGGQEALRLESMGLEVDESEAVAGVLSQPCAALRGRRCSIYAHRPKCCRTFECQLLQDVQRGVVTEERASEQVAEALQMIQRVGDALVRVGHGDTSLPLKERCNEALAANGDSSPEARRQRSELEAAMSAVEAMIWKTFLGSGAEKGP